MLMQSAFISHKSVVSHSFVSEARSQLLAHSRRVSYATLVTKEQKTKSENTPNGDSQAYIASSFLTKLVHFVSG